jgi:AcrR family transcriptional regulator
VIDAALDLFVEHGVGGTSLQMIADRIGVTKAAVYHQFPTKEEIVLAAAGAELARLETIIEAGEAEPDATRAQDVVIHGIVDLAVERRRAEGSLVSDPVIVRYYTNHKPFRQVMERLYSLLLGGQVGPEARLSASMLTAAIGGAAMHPMVVDLDDETLRSGLLRLATRFLDPPPSVPKRPPTKREPTDQG